MSESSSNPSSPAPRYTPPPELLHFASGMIEGASREELVLAARAYTAYGIPCGGRSGITGDKLPTLDACPVLPRAGWLAVVRYFAEVYGGPPPSMGTSEERVDPFLMGIREIAAATRDLAEASTLLSTSDSDASKAVATLVQDMAKCLSAQVRELTPPPLS